MFKRSSGVLAHVTSLPSPHGVGTMGRTACEFIDFLADAHQTYWQVLPSVIPASATRRTSASLRRRAIRI